MSDWHCKKRGWRMECLEDQKPQYFVVDPFKKEITAITNDPEGFRWGKPHVLIPTRGLHFKNAKIVNDDNNIWAEPIDVLSLDHTMPDTEPCIIGKPPEIKKQEETKEELEKKIVNKKKEHVMLAVWFIAFFLVLLLAKRFIF